MKKSVKIIISIFVLSIWSYLTLFISSELRIEACLDAGGSWDQTQNECMYIDYESILFNVGRYEGEYIDSDELLKELIGDLEKQFKIGVEEADQMIRVLNILKSADSISPEVIEDVKALLAEKEE